MKTLIKSQWRSLVFFFVMIIFVQALGNIVTMPNIPTWYASLNHPAWRPPNWVFGPVWTTLYIMLAFIGWRLWNSFQGGAINRLKKPAIFCYFVQLFLNAIWSPLFFGLHLIGISFVVLLTIILFTALTMFYASKFNRTLAWALAPYILWLIYASTLNGALTYLN
jgi:translocator protein